MMKCNINVFAAVMHTRTSHVDYRTSTRLEQGATSDSINEYMDEDR